MQNKKNINPHTLGRLLSTELRFSFNWGRFLFILALTIFPVLFYMVIPALVTFTGGM